MTRINCISPICLYDQHLFAEYREIARAISNVKKYLKKHSIFEMYSEIPSNYSLGKGHVKFFYNKLKYIVNRHEEIRRELLKRNYNISEYVIWDFEGIPNTLFNDFEPSLNDIKINLERIESKILDKPTFYKYYGE